MGTSQLVVRGAGHALVVAAATLVAASASRAQQSRAAGDRVRCASRRIAEAGFTVCEIPAAATSSLEIAPAPDPAARNWTIARLDSTLRASGRRLVMATNAGIFDPRGRPLGLLISRGREP